MEISIMLLSFFMILVGLNINIINNKLDDLIKSIEQRKKEEKSNE